MTEHMYRRPVDIKRYQLSIYESIHDEDGCVIDIPKNALYCSVEGGEYEYYMPYEGYIKERRIVLWMDNNNGPIVKRRFKALSEYDTPEDYMEFRGVFSLPSEWNDHDDVYCLYEYMIDIDELGLEWKKMKIKNWRTRIEWELKNYYLLVIENGNFGTRNWKLVIMNTINDNEYWDITMNHKTKTIPMKIAKYILEKYKSVKSIRELIQNKDIDLQQFM